VPTIALAGDSNPLYPLSSMAAQSGFFTGQYERRVLHGVGHNVPKEQPAAFIQAVKDVMG
jgi:pimeloyl-ACP methyl ester carboxylesterase